MSTPFINTGQPTLKRGLLPHCQPIPAQIIMTRWPWLLPTVPQLVTAILGQNPTIERGTPGGPQRHTIAAHQEVHRGLLWSAAHQEVPRGILWREAYQEVHRGQPLITNQQYINSLCVCACVCILYTCVLVRACICRGGPKNAPGLGLGCGVAWPLWMSHCHWSSPVPYDSSSFPRPVSAGQ